MKATDYLLQLRRLDTKINNKIWEMQQIRDLATRITSSLSGMPHPAGVTDKVGDAAVRLSHLGAEIDQITDQLIKARQSVIQLLETLPPEEYDLLHKVYVQGLTVEEIADGKPGGQRSIRQIYRVKARALRHVQAILDALPENKF